MTVYATQAEKVLTYLSKGKTLTSKQARARFKIMTLSARIFELREEGYNIETKPVVFRDTGYAGVAYSLAPKKVKKSKAAKASKRK
jgi:hypothetical protein